MCIVLLHQRATNEIDFRRRIHLVTLDDWMDVKLKIIIATSAGSKWCDIVDGSVRLQLHHSSSDACVR